MKYLFSTIQPWVITFYDMIRSKVFENMSIKDMTTVHLRRSDKGSEMKLLSTEMYMNAVKEIKKKINTNLR